MCQNRIYDAEEMKRTSIRAANSNLKPFSGPM
jgi:hypothetical protein